MTALVQLGDAQQHAFWCSGRSFLVTMVFCGGELEFFKTPMGCVLFRTALDSHCLELLNVVELIVYVLMKKV